MILKSDKKYLVENDLVNHSRFEFYLYKRACQKLDNGDFFVPESEQNKRLEDDLIPEDVWCRNKFKLIENTGLERLNTPIDLIITELGNKLSNKIAKACQRIDAQDNDFVTYLPKEAKLKWSIANRKWQEPVTNPIYSQVAHLNIIEILDFVQSKADFLRAFEHISKQRRNHGANPDDLLACIFGQGANYGIYKMSNISDRDIGTLRLVNDNYLRIETLHKANDIISNATAELLIFKHYTIHEPAPFASIDGQKFKCRINTFKARYSSKYFKKGKGVSAITLVSNHVPVNTDIISPNQYEGHFAFDLLYNNTTDLSPKTLSTDGHGINRVNHAILDIFGYSFAPRYPKFKDIFSELFDVMFDDELKIQLKTPINKNLLKSEWDSIQHIICSLSRKTTKQSIVIQKLSNSKRNNKTLMALREYDRLIKALYIIEYLDNKTLRHFVQQALNRGESFHQLRRAIASISGNQFRGGTDYQIEISNDCARLICNAIIFYNSALLSELLNIAEQKKDTKSVEVIANLSPVAWQHISLTGFYHFGQEKVDIDLQGMLDAIDPLSQTVD